MKVEFTTEQANALLYAAHFHRGLPWVADAAAILRAANSPDEDHPDDEARAHPPRPDWGWVTSGPLAAATAKAIGDSPGYLATADEAGATTRDAFDKLGLSLHDEQTVYVALVVTRFLFEISAQRRRQGNITEEALNEAAAAAGVFTAALLPYVPAEARQR